jgi:hypothetical protein
MPLPPDREFEDNGQVAAEYFAYSEALHALHAQVDYHYTLRVTLLMLSYLQATQQTVIDAESCTGYGDTTAITDPNGGRERRLRC